MPVHVLARACDTAKSTDLDEHQQLMVDVYTLPHVKPIHAYIHIYIYAYIHAYIHKYLSVYMYMYIYPYVS